MVNKLILWCSILFLLFSCKAKVPEDVLDKETMRDLLYDYHLAQSLAKKTGDSIDYRTRLYTDAVYRKYGITEEDFNHTMEWYTRNSEELYKIYQKVEEKFATATVFSKITGNPYADRRAEGDTMNLWRGENFYLLTSTWRNRMEFTLPADSTFEKGDRLMWQFDTHWFYREREKSALAELSVVYDNDSVVSTMFNLVTGGRSDLYIKLGTKPIKSIHGFIYLQSPWSEQPRILVVTDPVLVRFKKKKAVVPTSGDTVAVSNAVNDSIDTESEKNQVNLSKMRIGPEEPKARKEPLNPRMLRFPKATD